MKKLGAVREGVMRADRITWTGHVRDTVLFSILKDEWPVVARHPRASAGPSPISNWVPACAGVTIGRRWPSSISIMRR